MLLNVNQILFIFDSYKLERHMTQHGYSYYYKGKAIIVQINKNSANGYIWGRDISKYTDKYDIDPRGYIPYKDFTETEIRELLDQVLAAQDKLTNK